MAMSVGSGSGGVMCEINTTPLIDVMLVLLVTLIISLPVMTHAVKLDMPNPNAQPPPIEDSITAAEKPLCSRRASCMIFSA